MGDATRRAQREREVVVPVVEERLEVDLREGEAARLKVTTRTRTEEVDLDLGTAREELDVERVPVGRYVDRAPDVRIDGDTAVVPVLEEVLVVEKRLLLKEEVRVRRRRVEQPRSLRVPVRRQHVEIARAGPRAR